MMAECKIFQWYIRVSKMIFISSLVVHQLIDFRVEILGFPGMKSSILRALDQPSWLQTPIIETKHSIKWSVNH